jgi:hypothetical protein
VKIFRKQRFQLVADNKVAKYLRYAIGEILLVVIGILIALQVNNWNEHQKLKASEQQVLKSLLKEFQNNQKLLEETILRNKENLDAAQNLGKYTGPHLPPINEKELSQLMVGTFKYMVNYLPSMGTLYDVINSGKLSLISNQELRSNLAAFESVTDNVHRQENDVKEEQNVAHDFFISKGNFRRHLNVIDVALIDPTPSRFPNNDFKFLENPEFENHLYYYIVMAANLDKNFYAPLLAKQDFIIHLIQSEIH